MDAPDSEEFIYVVNECLIFHSEHSPLPPRPNGSDRTNAPLSVTHIDRQQPGRAGIIGPDLPRFPADLSRWHPPNRAPHRRAGLARSTQVAEGYVQTQRDHVSAQMTRKSQHRRNRFRVNPAKTARLCARSIAQTQLAMLPNPPGVEPYIAGYIP